MNEKLIQYIKRNLDAGYSGEAIMRALVKAGYDGQTMQQYIHYTMSNYTADNEVYHSPSNISSKKIKSFAGAIIALIAITIIAYGAYLYLPNFRESSKNELNNDEINNIEIGAGATGKNEDNLNQLNSALVEHNLKICQSIANDALREQCSSSFAANENETCNEECQNQNLLNTALINSNPDSCSKITNNAIKESCLYNFNTTKNIESQCDSLCKDKELLNSALIRRDGSFCVEINDSAIKTQCEGIFKKEVD